MAPRRRAVAMAWSPATPAPSTSTRAGDRVPAAVTSIGKKRPVAAAASRTALYPATVACDDSTSIGCARVIRGSNARLNAVTLRAASAATTSRSAAGWNSATSAAPSRHSPTSAVEGGCTLRTTSLRPKTSAGVATRPAPAARYASSGNAAAAPAHQPPPVDVAEVAGRDHHHVVQIPDPHPAEGEAHPDAALHPTGIEAVQSERAAHDREPQCHGAGALRHGGPPLSRVGRLVTRHRVRRHGQEGPTGPTDPSMASSS